MTRRSRTRRLLLVLVLAAVIAPGTWLRTPRKPESGDLRPILVVSSLPPRTASLGALEVAGVWRLQSPNGHFGGYSALMRLQSGRLFAISDNGRQLEFTPPGEGPLRPEFDFFTRRTGDKWLHDAESITRDPVSGRMWVAYEQNNRILRLDGRKHPTGVATPRQMRDWPSNAGAESMVRLADGRFIVLAESDPRWFAADRPGLLFPGDPVDGPRALEFRFAGPAGYEPVDMAELPDGRVLILLRAIKLLPPRIASKLVVADPAGIRRGRKWGGTVIADLDTPFPADNYEGMAIGPADGGGVTVWLISDDNSSVWLQRTLLAKLVWRDFAAVRPLRRPS